VSLFVKKIMKKDDFEAPVPETARYQAWTAPGAAGGTDAGGSDWGRAAPPLESAAPYYSIDDAIELMRQLPQDNTELVVRVVKITLQSLKIDIGSIIKDAERKQNEIQARVSVLRKEIDDLDREIKTRKAEIAALDAGQKEATLVKDRLSMAEKGSVGQPAVTMPLPA